MSVVRADGRHVQMNEEPPHGLLIGLQGNVRVALLGRPRSHLLAGLSAPPPLQVMCRKLLKAVVSSESNLQKLHCYGTHFHTQL